MPSLGSLNASSTNGPSDLGGSRGDLPTLWQQKERDADLYEEADGDFLRDQTRFLTNASREAEREATARRRSKLRAARRRGRRTREGAVSLGECESGLLGRRRGKLMREKLPQFSPLPGLNLLKDKKLEYAEKLAHRVEIYQSIHKQMINDFKAEEKTLLEALTSRVEEKMRLVRLTQRAKEEGGDEERAEIEVSLSSCDSDSIERRGVTKEVYFAWVTVYVCCPLSLPRNTISLWSGCGRSLWS